MRRLNRFPAIRWHSYWPIAVLLGLTLLFFHRLAFSGLILARGDTYAYFYPYWAVRNAALMQGHLPLWSPDILMGVPLLANPQLGTFYPPNWLVAALSPPEGLRLSVLLHVFWALLGVYALARQMRLDAVPALAAAALFGLGGYLGAHAEQINQLQGLAWLPWLLWLCDRAPQRPRLYLPLLAACLALQIFSGHTQTSFISVTGLGLYGVIAPRTWRDRLRMLLILAGAGLLALLLSLPQIIPTLELTLLSNRSGGLSAGEATSFSFNLAVAGRGLLPSYDGLLFGEYITYAGITGLGLALLGILLPRERARWPWIALALIGLLLAMGDSSQLYLWLLNLPIFRYFRVPARWLALFSLGIALLGGYGLQALLAKRPRPWHYGLIAAMVLFLGLSTRLIVLVPESVIGPAEPTVLSWLGWAFALAALLIVLALRRTPWLLPLLLLELFAAGQILPYNMLSLPETYSSQRFSISQLLAYGAEQTPPGRMLSISQLLFDPGDRAALEARYRGYGFSDLVQRISLVDTKLKEIVAPNQPLIRGIPSIDGFDGGLLPTRYYSAFSSLLTPDGEPTVDGRLREALALEECRGACLPDQRWLNLTNTQYLITDKVFDLWHEDISYDTQIHVPLPTGDETVLDNPTGFTATAIDLLYTGESSPTVTLQSEESDSLQLSLESATPLDEFERGRWISDLPIEARQFVIRAESEMTLVSATLVDTRTGAFIALTPGPWQRLLSSDIKLYGNQTALPRAFLVQDAGHVPDPEALARMAEPDFDPSRYLLIQSDTLIPVIPSDAKSSSATITDYTSEQVTINVEAGSDAWLLLTDAYYPGWQATIDGEATPIYRADIMFRAIYVPAGSHEVVFAYRPAWLPGILWGGVLAWGLVLAWLVVQKRSNSLQP